MRQIVCLSTSNWEGHPTSKQQVMSRIKDAEILYFDPPITMIAPLKDKSAKPRMSKYKEKGFKPAENITVYALPPVLPLYNKHRSLNRMNQRRIAAFVREKMKKHGFHNPVLWVYHPSNVDAIEHIPHSSLVYHCVDRHSAYPGLIDPAVVDGMEAELARKCDMIFATAKGLAETLKKYTDNVHLLPNGANYELFSRVDEPGLPIPNDLFNIQKPILGFIGALQDCNDYSLVSEAARRHPEWSFVFIGNPLPGVDLSEITGRDNIHLLGPKPHNELVCYIANFDACLNLFRPNALSKDVSPLKFYEYLATGKPIVSTPQPEQILDYRDVIYIGATPDEFEQQCARAIADTSPELKAKRQAYGRLCSWDARVSELREVLASKNILTE